MFKVKVLTIGKSKEEWLQKSLAEYEKRLQKELSIEWVYLKDFHSLKQELGTLSYIALDPQGKHLSSEEWAGKMQELGSRFNFVIGGAEGLDREIRQKADWVWSLSLLTFTHQMTRLILVEQLYRALQIQNNRPYHK